MVDRVRDNLFHRMTDTTSPLNDDVVTFDSVKHYLRQLGNHEDQAIDDAVKGAVDDAESHCNWTWRQSVTSTAFYCDWTHHFFLPKPPAVSVTSVKYYDPDDTLTTVTASDYELLAAKGQAGVVEFQADFTFPNLNHDRVDPIEIVFVRGYTDSATVPAAVKVAIRMFAESVLDGDHKKYDEAIQRLRTKVYRGKP